MRAIWMAGPAVALSGCGGGTPGNEAANVQNVVTPAARPGPSLAGIDLDAPIRAGGAGWTIDLAPGSILYAAPGARGAIDLYPVSPRLDGDRATFPTETPGGERVTVVLIARPCGDTHPLTAEATIGTRTLRGCAAPKPAEPLEPGNASAGNATD